ncbi:MAG: hypothetical protein EXQ89_06395 [Rhodospirillaceae bacterium]|nr:hypothetical protein [Rhodospirillaceae bacterium]
MWCKRSGRRQQKGTTDLPLPGPCRIVFGAGHTFVDLQEPKSDIMKNGLTGRLVGTYDEYLHFLALNVSVKF